MSESGDVLSPLDLMRQVFADRIVQLLFVFHVALLTVAAVQNADALNTDAIAYIRIAEYWQQGQMELAVSGY